MTFEIKFAVKIDTDKKKSPAKSTKGKTQSQSQTTVILTQK